MRQTEGHLVANACGKQQDATGVAVGGVRVGARWNRPVWFWGITLMTE